MRSAYDAIILGTEENVVNPKGLFTAMRHQRELLMVSVICTLSLPMYCQTNSGSLLCICLSCCPARFLCKLHVRVECCVAMHAQV